MANEDLGERKLGMLFFTAIGWLIHIATYLPIAIYDIAWKSLNRLELGFFVIGCALVGVFVLVL